MKIFISWSGEASHQVAQALFSWLPKVIQTIEPFLSSENIESGSRRHTEIATQLESTNFGILCLTPENLDSRWLLFEAGALSKSLNTARVCPYLYDLKISDVLEPLAQFNATIADKEGTYKLLKNINSASEKPLEIKTLEETFETWWSKLEKELENVSVIKETAVRPERPLEDVVEEILETVREISQNQSKNAVRLNSWDIADATSYLPDYFSKIGKGIVKNPKHHYTISVDNFDNTIYSRFPSLLKTGGVLISHGLSEDYKTIYLGLSQEVQEGLLMQCANATGLVITEIRKNPLTSSTHSA